MLCEDGTPKASPCPLATLAGWISNGKGGGGRSWALGSQDGNKYICVAMGYFSKWLETYDILDQKDPTVAKLLVNKFFYHFGESNELLSYLGKTLSPQSLMSAASSRVSGRPAPPLCTRSLMEWLGNLIECWVMGWQSSQPMFNLLDIRSCLVLIAYKSAVRDTMGVCRRN